jgi:hypothetical protein
VSVTKGDYGPVVVLAGEHRGQVGYYDDDDGPEGIVYLGEPFVSEYVRLPREALGKGAGEQPGAGAVEAGLPVSRQVRRRAVAVEKPWSVQKEAGHQTGLARRS